MRTKSEIIYEALRLLNEHLGIVETEIFISSLIKDPFDYTKWQKELWKDKTIDQIYNEAKEFESKRK